MILKKIIAKNFLSYKDLEYDFVNKPLMIQGLNLTDDKQKSNGSGKSSIQTMIEFCLTGDNSKGVRDTELVMFGCKESFLELFVKCSVRNEEIHILWNIKIKGSNQLSILISKENNVWEEVSFSNVNDGKKWIINWLGISKNDLFNYFIINKTRFKSFFKSSNKEKVELINRFSDASIIDGIEEIDKTELESKYDSIRHDISKSEGKLQLLEENLLKELKRNLNDELQDSKDSYSQKNTILQNTIQEIELEKQGFKNYIKELEEEIIEINLEKEQLKKNTFKKDILEFEETIKPLQKQLEKAQISVNNFIKTDFDTKIQLEEETLDKIDSEIEVFENKLSEIKDKEIQVLKILENLEIKLSGKITCPSCSHSFLKDKETSLEKVLESKQKVDLIKTSLEKSSKEISININNLEKEKEKPELKIIDIEKEELKEKQSYKKLFDKISDINVLINNKNQELKVLEIKLKKNDSNIELLSDEVKQIEEEILDKKRLIKDKNQEINSLKINIESNNSLINNLQISDNSKQISEIKDSIKELKKQTILSEGLLMSVEKELFKLNEWSANFKQFKLHVANLSLETIQYHSNRFLEGMGTDLRVRFDGFKVLADGTIKDSITATIIRDRERTFNSFSGGEQGRLLFSSILANRFMINNTHPYGGLQFLSIDEVFEGVDSLGLQSLVEESKNLQECIMIISHITDEDIICDNLMIVRENGISKIR